MRITRITFMIFSLAGLMLNKHRQALGAVILVALTLASAVSGFQFIAKVITATAQ